MHFHLTTRIGELGGMVPSNQELCRWGAGKSDSVVAICRESNNFLEVLKSHIVKELKFSVIVNFR
jgi:hypothetical protein